MILSWLERRRRERILAGPFPPDWLDYLRKNVPVYDLLPAADQTRLRDDLRVFIAEKTWEGCGGQAITDEVKVTVAAQACLLLLGVEHDYFGQVQTILVYPSAYQSPDGDVGPDGVVHQGIGRLGEAWHGGPVILGWDAVRSGGRNRGDGGNVVLHEFAHQLDFLDGLADGTPPLKTAEEYRRWQRVMTAEYDRLRQESGQGKATLLGEYGATDPAEFFAVATEFFFAKPVPMQRRHPELYDVLRDYFCQDPAAWFTPTGAAARAPAQINPAEKMRPRRGRRPHRGTGSRRSRHAAALGPAFGANQPGWVRFWMLGTYWPRQVAVDRLRLMLCVAVVCLVLGGLALGGVGRRAFGAVIAFSLAGVTGGSAVWLGLAVRWVDRTGWPPPRPEKGPQP
jgi:Mlc titration factor MtfA (ptsG expression regulator)